MDVAVAVAGDQHVVDVGADDRGHRAAQPQPGHDRDLARHADQVQRPDAHAAAPGPAPGSAATSRLTARAAARCPWAPARRAARARAGTTSCGDRVSKTGLRPCWKPGKARPFVGAGDRGARRRWPSVRCARPSPVNSRRDRDVGQVDVGQPGVERRPRRVGARPEQRGRRVVLARPDDAGVLELVLGRAAARAPVQVRRHVAGVGLRERGDEPGGGSAQVVDAIAEPLPGGRRRSPCCRC